MTGNEESGDCCPPFSAHRTGLFGEYLYLRPRGGEVPYAVPINGAIVPPPVNPVQVGPVALVDPDYSSGFRLGGSLALDDCTSIVGTYTFYESHTAHAVQRRGRHRPAVPGNQPWTMSAGTDYLNAAADLNIDFQAADVDYRTVLWLGQRSVVNWLIGARTRR